MKPAPMAAKRGHPLQSIFHPLWCSIDDHTILRARGLGDGFDVIAQRLGRSEVAVRQRWHRLSAVRNVMRHLVEFGPTAEPYTLNDGGR